MDEHRTQLEDRPIAELVRQLSDQTTTLVRQEIELAKSEMTAKGKQVGMGAGAFGAAGLVGFTPSARSPPVDPRAEHRGGRLARGADRRGGVAIAAGVLALVGKKKTQAGAPPVPERAISSAKEDVEWAKTRAKTARR